LDENAGASDRSGFFDPDRLRLYRGNCRRIIDIDDF
jgi:hypothetical protein